jgi:hypothetical protein
VPEEDGIGGSQPDAIGAGSGLVDGDRDRHPIAYDARRWATLPIFPTELSA